MIVSSETMSPTWVAAVALVNESHRVLMQERPIGSMHSGLWEFPGGKLEVGEAPEEAAVREIAEELGITINSEDLQPVTFAGAKPATDVSARSLVILLFLCRRWQGAPAPHAAARIAWIDPKALAALPMPPLDYPLAEGLCKMLAADAF